MLLKIFSEMILLALMGSQIKEAYTAELHVSSPLKKQLARQLWLSRETEP